MEKFLFGVLTLVLGGTVGLVLASGAMHLKQYRLARRRHDRGLVLRALGTGITMSILLVRVVQNATVRPDVWAWAYLVGMLILFLGLMDEAVIDIRETVEVEVEHDSKDKGEVK